MPKQNFIEPEAFNHFTEMSDTIINIEKHKIKATEENSRTIHLLRSLLDARTGAVSGL